MTNELQRRRLSVPPLRGNAEGMVMSTEVEKMRRQMQDEFNRLSDDFYDFRKATLDAAILPLKGPSNIAITSNQYSMSATWENPQQDTITPTHIRIRILEISPNDFAEYTYPIDSWEFNGLLPGTQYTLQIQIVARFETTDTFVSTTRNCPSLPVLRVAESDIRAKVFTTDEGVSPPNDNGTDDTNVEFDFPDTDGDPGAVDSSDCWWEYKFQYRTVCAWSDTAVSNVEVAGDVGNVTIDTGAVPFTTYPNSLFRLAYREVCDGTPEDWVYGEPFMAVDFSEADCLGIVKNASSFVVPYSAATIYQLPAVCQDDGTFLQIVNGTDDTEFTQGLGLKCIEYIDNEWTLIGKDTETVAINPLQPMITGNVAEIGTFNTVTDFSFSFDIKQPSAYPTPSLGITQYPIIDIGGKIKAYFIGRDTSFDIMVQVPRDGGGVYSIRATNLSYGIWNNIYYVHDVSEADGRVIFANGVEVGRGQDTAIENDFSGITSTVTINTIPETEIRRAYFWNTAVSSVDIANDNAPYESTADLPGVVDPDTFDVEVGDLILGVVSSRGAGLPIFAYPANDGTSTAAAFSDVVSTIQYDGAGVSRGAARVIGTIITGAGTFIPNVSGDRCASFVRIPAAEVDSTSGLTSAIGTTASDAANYVSGPPTAASVVNGAASAAGSIVVAMWAGGGTGGGVEHEAVFTSGTAGLFYLPDSSIYGQASGSSYATGTAIWAGPYTTPVGATTTEDLTSGGWAMFAVEVVAP